MVHARSLLRNSPIGYQVRRRRYNSRLTPNPELAPQPEVAQQAIDRGISIVEGHLDESQTSRIRNEMLVAVETPTGGENVFFDLEPSTPGFDALREIAHSPYLERTMQAIAGAPTELYHIRTQIRNPASDTPEIDLWHTDTWRLRLKAMLFLDDVDSGTGPMVYAAGTNRRSVLYPARWLYDYRRELRPLSGHTLANWVSLPREKIVCTGSAGTMVIFDTRGFHTARSPVTRPRMTSTFAFTLKEDIRR